MNNVPKVAGMLLLRTFNFREGPLDGKHCLSPARNDPQVQRAQKMGGPQLRILGSILERSKSHHCSDSERRLMCSLAEARYANGCEQRFLGISSQA